MQDPSVLEGAYEQVVAILRAQTRGGEKKRVRRRNRRGPAEFRVAVMRPLTQRDRLTRIMSITTGRPKDPIPSAIEARRDAIDLVEALRAILGLPQCAVQR